MCSVPEDTSHKEHQRTHGPRQPIYRLAGHLRPYDMAQNHEHSYSGISLGNLGLRNLQPEKLGGAAEQ